MGIAALIVVERAEERRDGGAMGPIPARILPQDSHGSG
jgi:hypothetical protein